MIHVLATGVFFSGFLKDLLCLPRPLSPPLERISKSASAALEYGFPSTHSTNSVSVVIYAMYLLHTSKSSLSTTVYLAIQVSFYFYTISIVVGRLYCGMHGFFDVIIGAILGAGLAIAQCMYGDAFDAWIYFGPFRNVVLFTLIVLVLVRIHPEPADDCPCFDDSVAFSGVIIGAQIGGWHFARSSFSWVHPVPSTAPYLLAEIGWVKTVLRVLVGVVMIFIWRGTMKPTLFKVLPPVFRVVETLGLSLPRKFFLQAS